MNKEIEEILKYLEQRSDYVIWAGFAQHAHLGLPYSPDVDVYVDSVSALEEISQELHNLDWRLEPHQEKTYRWNKLERNDTTFDVVYTDDASNLLFNDIVVIDIYGHKLRFISKEWLFITKLGQLTWPDRTEEKRTRDIEVLQKLRESMDVEKIKHIASQLPEKYWELGEI